MATATQKPNFLSDEHLAAQLARLRAQAEADAKAERATRGDQYRGLRRANAERKARGYPSPEQLKGLKASMELRIARSIRNDPIRTMLLARIRRAFRRASKEATPAEVAAFLDELLAAGVPVINRTSRRIARVIRGEKPLLSLLVNMRTRKTWSLQDSSGVS
jgi:hypothetical protein